ncbi:MAG: prepilin-type N-terminal cleavage/methylation domain-containing protein [Candidatus Nomurabacteria bacterium]
MKKFTSPKGFTLIELLVVIAIIGILGAIVYAPFQTARRKGRDAQKIVEIKNLQSSLLLYSDSNNGVFPATLIELENSQTDKLPTKANRGNTYDPSLYNYAPFVQNGKVIGFHLWTHLETASPVLSGAAQCVGTTATNPTAKDGTPSNSPCFVGTGITQPTITYGAVPDDQTGVNFASSTRTSDTDSACATDVNSCIYDLKS